MSKINEIYEALTNRLELQGVTKDDSRGLTYIRIPNVIGPASNKFDAVFISDNDEKIESISVRVFNIVNFSEDQREKAYEVLNEINEDYKLLKLSIDTDGDVSGEFDFLDANVDAVKSSVEVLLRFDHIITDVYPKLMKAKWA